MEKGKPVKDKKNSSPSPLERAGVRYKPDPALRDAENVPLKENIETYFKREVLPHVPDAWIDYDKNKVGYEINFNREFYEYRRLRSLAEVRKDIVR